MTLIHKELFQFVKSGAYVKECFTVRKFLKILVSYFVFVIPVSIPLIIIRFLLPISDTVHDQRTFSGMYLLTVILWAPVLEELSFRLFLKPVKINLSVGITILVTGVLKTLFFKDSSHLYLLLSIPIAGGIYFLFTSVQTEFRTNVLTLIHGSTILFGFLHIYNYLELEIWMLLAFPILTAPQILMGYISAFTRLKYGFVASIGFHMGVNALASLSFFKNMIFR